MRAFNVCSICIALFAVQSFAQKSPYAGLDSRPIKALSAEQIEQYRSGKGMGFAMAAELNGYPGPRHVLDLGKELELSPDQTEKVQKIFDAMLAQALRLGTEYVEQERRLDSLFASRTVTTGEMDALLGELGSTYSKLRGTHLRAHVQTAELLTQHQMRQYATLRGYGAPTEHDRSMKH